MGLSPDDMATRLAAHVAEVAGCAVEITRLDKLSGGAIQENWAVDMSVASGDWTGDHQLVLRRDSQTSVEASHGRAEEFALLKAAHEAGVTVPTPCFVSEDAAVLGGPFFLMHRVAGDAAGHRLAKASANPALAETLGRDLARIHTLRPPREDLSFLGPAPADPAAERVALYRAWLDNLDHPLPALEWGLAWLERTAPPPPAATVLCHRDYRTGNLMVADGQLTAVLDWEFAGWGDPLEDIGWFCAACWRFGAQDREAGGIAAREDFYAGYEAEAGGAVARDGVFYWEVMAHVRWAVIAAQQAARHLSGEEQSLELSLTGHMVPELELAILTMTEEG